MAQSSLYIKLAIISKATIRSGAVFKLKSSLPLNYKNKFLVPLLLMMPDWMTRYTHSLGPTNIKGNSLVTFMYTEELLRAVNFR